MASVPICRSPTRHRPQSRPAAPARFGLWDFPTFGAYALYETGANGVANDVYAVHDGQLTEIVQAYLNDDKVSVSGLIPAGANTGGNVAALTDGRYAGNNIQFYMTDGRSPGVVFGAPIANLPGIWTANHRGDGVVMMCLTCSPVKSEDFLEIYPNGVPTPSVAAKWQRCPDPFAEDPTDQSQWTWTENAIRHLMHYKMVREGVDYATKIAPTLSYWQDAAAVCDEAVALKAGGAEARWRSSVAHKHTDKHGDVTGAILATCDGWISPRSDGALVVYAGKYVAPTVNIDSSHIVAFEWEGVGVDDDQAINEIICSYISADHDYNTVECDAWRDEDNIAERGQILSDPLDPQVPSWGQVRRLAKRRMARTNALFRGTVTTNIAGRIARGHRYIHLTLQEAGATFYIGPVEITAVTRNIATGGITFSWVAADPNIDAWNEATEEGEPAALGDRVAAEPLDAPSISDAEAEIAESGTNARIRITVDGYDREDITWYARWRITTDTTWNEQGYSDIDPGPSAILLTSVVPVDVGIDVEVAYGVGDGRTSPWSELVTVSTASDIIFDGGDASTEA